MSRHPILYPADTLELGTLGIGALTDAITCRVTEELDGEYILEMRYPMEGIHYAQLRERMLIGAVPHPGAGVQLFRIMRITAPIGGIVTVYANHVSYDLDGIPVNPFSAESAAGAMQALGGACTELHPFSFDTTKATTGKLSIKLPRSARAALMGQSGSILDVYTGDYIFDNYRVTLVTRRGADHGYRIRYGVNLIDLEQERNCEEVYTGVFPYWYDETEDAYVSLPEGAVYAAGEYGFIRVKVLDLTAEFDEKPTVEQLRSRATKYIEDNDIGRVRVSLDVSFADLTQFEEYRDAPWADAVELGDTVHVDFIRLGVAQSARITRTVYDVLRGEYESIHVGSERTTLAETLVSMENAVKEAAGNALTAGRGYAKLMVQVTDQQAVIDGIVTWIGDDESGAAQSLAQLTIAAEQNAADIELLAQSTAEGFQDVTAQLSVKVGKDENDQIVSMLNASAQMIRLKSNRLTIESDNFTLAEDGSITAKNATLDGTFETTGEEGRITMQNGIYRSSSTVLGKTGGLNIVGGILYAYWGAEDDADFTTHLMPTALDMSCAASSGGKNSFQMMLQEEHGSIAFDWSNGNSSYPENKTCVLFFAGNEMSAYGRLKAVPATVEENASGRFPMTYSPVITRQDLVNLGLISA